MKPTVLVLGSGPIRIGQGIEFDYSCVHCVWALEKMGYRAIIVNNNPETVSTDFDTGDGLYFEPVTFEDVMDIVRHENPIGVVVQFGGQTAINLADRLEAAGVRVLGTPPSAIAAAEDRDQFEKLLATLGIEKPAGRAVTSLTDAIVVAQEVGYPVLVRPSFVLGGRAMEIIHSDDHLRGFYKEAEDANPGQPVLIDKYLYGQEAEVDVISDGTDTLVPGIMEHIERAGVHSGDSIAVYPPVSLSPHVQSKMVSRACQIARELGVNGIMNIQFVIVDGDALVLEVNPRASRTVPYLSKVTGIPMVHLATRCMMGEKLTDLGYTSGLWELGSDSGHIVPPSESSPKADGSISPVNEVAKGVAAARLYAVKAPVFSFQKLGAVEPSLGPEMKSTGEVLGLDYTFEAALYKALIASGITFKSKGMVILTVGDEDKPAAVEIARELHSRGYTLGATSGTHAALESAGVPCRKMNKIKEGGDTLLSALFRGEVSLMVNTPQPGQSTGSDAARIRRACIETGVACVTSVDTARALARSLHLFEDPSLASCMTITEYVKGLGAKVR
ncbi:carbamoyl-phosphate synthase large subunit [Kamptonema cortianum]|nr:carbamoyl-phosphate synthase large subunit [Geitlerinema splendidum]MDK3158631.1 carbamoyl-phosphate synthase large subunit [Kamptonema cortianum]